MITISTLFILLYSYSLYKIRKDSGSWKEFDPLGSGLFVWLVFLTGTVTIIMVVLGILCYGILGYAVQNNLIP